MQGGKTEHACLLWARVADLQCSKQAASWARGNISGLCRCAPHNAAQRRRMVVMLLPSHTKQNSMLNRLAVSRRKH